MLWHCFLADIYDDGVIRHTLSVTLSTVLYLSLCYSLVHLPTCRLSLTPDLTRTVSSKHAVDKEFVNPEI